MYFLFHPISSLNHLVARLVTDQISFFLSVIFFVILALNYKKPLWQTLDEIVSNWAVNSKENFIKKRSNELSMFGNAIFHILLSIVLAVLFFVIKHKVSIVISILFTLIFSWGLNRCMKLIFKRERPYSEISIKRRRSYCFPSGHVMASISVYFFCAVLLQGLITFIPWYLVALVISFFVVMTRIYLNHHYFTDVLGGICMGIFCLCISIWFYFFVGLI